MLIPVIFECGCVDEFESPSEDDPQGTVAAEYEEGGCLPLEYDELCFDCGLEFDRDDEDYG